MQMDELERRIRQFEHYLGLMEHRAKELVEDECYLIFDIESEGRFVQFAFDEDNFYLELPNTTLSPDEAEEVMGDRPNFQFTDRSSEFDPLRTTTNMTRCERRPRKSPIFALSFGNALSTSRLKCRPSQKRVTIGSGIFRSAEGDTLFAVVLR